jgi:peptidoglycan/xylan/chitin deacetylase (PgdA/CDA1 family)
MILSVDDGCASDMRIAKLAQKYNVETVFYWPVEWRSLAYEKGYKPLNYAEACDIARQFEIGAHTVTHRHLTKISLEEARIEIVDSKLMLEVLFAKDITKFCPPRGYTNPELTETTLAIYDSQRLTKGKGLVHIHPSSGANNNMDWRLFALAQEEVKELWCHSWELDKYNLWDELEEYFAEHKA